MMKVHNLLQNILLTSLLSFCLITHATPSANATKKVPLQRIKQTLVAPPFLPKHTQTSSTPKIVEVHMVIEEKLHTIDNNGTTIQAMTFNGSVPGPIIVAHQDDYIELTLTNPETNQLLHNIDFHAATGALGGGTLTKVFPGQETRNRFKV